MKISDELRAEAADVLAVMASDRAQHAQTGGSTSYMEVPGASLEAKRIAGAAHMAVPTYNDEWGRAMYHLEYAHAEAWLRLGWPDKDVAP